MGQVGSIFPVLLEKFSESVGAGLTPDTRRAAIQAFLEHLQTSKTSAYDGQGVSFALGLDKAYATEPVVKVWNDLVHPLNMSERLKFEELIETTVKRIETEFPDFKAKYPQQFVELS